MKVPEKIRSERLVLCRYKAEDARGIFDSYAQDPEVTRYLTWKPHKSIEETQDFVQKSIQEWIKGERFTWTVHNSKVQLIGSICLRINGHKADFGYVIARNHWGKGYATEALTAVLQWTIQQTQIFRIWGVCDIENIASARVMEKCGLKHEGILRKWGVCPNISPIPRDSICFSMIKEYTE